MTRELFTATFTDIEPINKELSYATVWVMYADENRNKSNISKEVIEDAIPTIFGIPIVAEYIESKDDFGSHGGKIIIENDNITYVRTTTPYGFVPESAKISWKTSEKDGKEYLVIENVIIWVGRYPECEELLNDGRPQSMEVDFIDAKKNEKTGLMDVKKMSFSALCILGEDIEAAFEGAKISFAYSREEIYTQIKDMIFELNKYDLNQSNTQGGVNLNNFDTSDKKHIDINNTKDSAVMDGSWGDVDKTYLRNELTDADNAGALVKEGYLIVNSDWKDAPSESLHYPHHVVKDGVLVVHKNGLEAAHARLAQQDPNHHEEHAWSHVERHYKELGLDMSTFSLENFSLSSEQLEGELRLVLRSGETFVDPFWGFEEQRYYYVDNQDGVVVVQDCKLGGLVGFKFTVAEDKVSVDFDSGLRYKIDYAPMQGVNGVPDGDEGESNATDGDDFSLLTKDRKEFIKSHIDGLNTKVSSANEKATEAQSKATDFEIKANEFKTNLDGMNAEFTSLKEEVVSLREFKQNKSTEEQEQKINAVIAKFASHLSEEELNTFKENSDGFSVEEMETKLYALIGKKAEEGKFSFNGAKNGSLRVPLFTREDPLNNPSKTKIKKPYADMIQEYRSSQG